MIDVQYAPIALAEYDLILAGYSAQKTAKLQASVRDAIDFIARFPEGSPMCDDRHRRHSLRKFPYGLIYRIDSNGVVIVAFAHNRRLPGYWCDRA